MFTIRELYEATTRCVSQGFKLSYMKSGDINTFIPATVMSRIKRSTAGKETSSGELFHPHPTSLTIIWKRKLENASSLLQPPQTHSGNLLLKYSSCFPAGRHLSEQIASSISNRLVVIHRINVSLNMRQQKHSVIKTVYIKVSMFSDVCLFF